MSWGGSLEVDTWKIASAWLLRQLLNCTRGNIACKIDPSKSTMYTGSINASRLSQLVHLLGFNIGDLPFIWSGELHKSKEPWAFNFKRQVGHHFFSSTNLENSTWKIGNGEDIIFLNDSWGHDSLANIFQIPPSSVKNLYIYQS